MKKLPPLTPWFPAKKRPARFGKYEFRSTSGGKELWRQFVEFGPAGWIAYDHRGWHMFPLYPGDQWRGLTRPAE